jgi:hypothetical protein
MKKLKDDTIQLIEHFLQIKTNKLRKEEEKNERLIMFNKEMGWFLCTSRKG